MTLAKNGTEVIYNPSSLLSIFSSTLNNETTQAHEEEDRHAACSKG